MELQASNLDYIQWEQVPLIHSTVTHDHFLLDHLKPKTRYAFRLKIIFTEVAMPYIWPTDNRFAFETLGINLF